MSSEFNIDDKTRFLVLYLDADFKVSVISKLLDRSERTLRDWAIKTNRGQDIRKIIPGRGQKAKITQADEKKVVRQVRETPHKASTRMLAVKDDLGKSTIYRILTQKGFRYRNYGLLSKLTSDQEEERIGYCQEMTANNGEAIYQTFFSDEMGIRLSEAHKAKGWQRPEEIMELEFTDQNLKLNCWGAVSAEGATSLEIFEDNLKGSTYQSILEKHIPEMDGLYPDGFFFVHDNHQSHKAVEGWMANHNLERIKFPNYSPDLNIIENIWSALKDSVAKDAPSSKAGLIRSLQRNWETITTPQNLRPYFESLHSRYFECIEIEGKRLPY